MQALRYAVRPMVILKHFGMLCSVLALSSVVPLAVSLWFDEYRVSFRYSIVVAGIFCLGADLMRLPTHKRLLTHETMAITVLIFLFAPLVMTFPVMASGL